MTTAARYALIFLACTALIVYGCSVTWWTGIGAAAGLVLSVATVVTFWDPEERIERVDGAHRR